MMPFRRALASHTLLALLLWWLAPAAPAALVCGMSGRAVSAVPAVAAEKTFCCAAPAAAESDGGASSLTHRSCCEWRTADGGPSEPATTPSSVFTVTAALSAAPAAPAPVWTATVPAALFAPQTPPRGPPGDAPSSLRAPPALA